MNQYNNQRANRNLEQVGTSNEKNVILNARDKNSLSHQILESFIDLQIVFNSNVDVLFEITQHNQFESFTGIGKMLSHRMFYDAR